MTVQELRAQIILHANESGLNPDLVAAVCAVESSFNPMAMRYEPGWRYLLRPEIYAANLCITTLSESTLQKFSFGLMQVMGSVAREYKFSGYLTELLQVDNALRYGCKHLRTYLKIYGSEKSAVSAYNQGSADRDSKNLGFKNQAYVDKVFSFYGKRLITSL